MRAGQTYFVYVVASRSRNFYIGVTNSLMRRVKEHKEGTHDGHTSRYKIDRLVHFERFAYIDNAIAREKQLKGWLRSRKFALISAANPTWEDLSLTFGQAIPPPPAELPRHYPPEQSEEPPSPSTPTNSKTLSS